MSLTGEEILCVWFVQRLTAAAGEGVQSRFCPASDKLKSTALPRSVPALIHVHYRWHPLYLGLLSLFCTI